MKTVNIFLFSSIRFWEVHPMIGNHCDLSINWIKRKVKINAISFVSTFSLLGFKNMPRQSRWKKHAQSFPPHQRSFRRKLHQAHGKKGFVILTKSFVKIWITKTFYYNNNMFSSVNKTFSCCSKMFGWLFVVPNFVAVTKPFFSVHSCVIGRPQSKDVTWDSSKSAQLCHVGGREQKVYVYCNRLKAGPLPTKCSIHCTHSVPAADNADAARTVFDKEHTV